MSFPAHFPNACPPTSAEDVRGEIYRFVRNDPPVAADFVSFYIEGKSYAPDNKCQACGLSVLRTEEDVKEACRVSPWFKKRKVAKARVSPEWGKIARTAGNNIPNHCTWWVSDGREPNTIFDVVVIR